MSMNLPVGQSNLSSSGPPLGRERKPFDVMGGEPVVRALVDRFYDLMHSDPSFVGIRALHQPDLAEARAKLGDFFCGWLGGPNHYVQKHGHPRLRARHMPFAIGDTERDQWMACMNRAIDDCRLSDEIRSFLLPRLQQVADFLRNR